MVKIDKDYVDFRDLMKYSSSMSKNIVINPENTN